MPARKGNRSITRFRTGTLILWAFVVMAVAGGGPAAAQNPALEKRPNILVIMTDDQQAGMMGYEGGKWIKTPNIDRLAAEGLIFDHMYTPIGQCAPTRATFITGLLPHNHGLVRNRLPLSVPSDRIFLPNLFRQQGYHTALIGKCHFGPACHDPEDQQTEEVLDNIDYEQLGFDTAITIEPRVANLYDFHVIHDAKTTQHVTGQYVTDHTTDLALDHIAAYASQEKPFFLWLAYNAPHEPWTMENLPPEFNPARGGALPDIPKDADPMVEDLAQKSFWQSALSLHEKWRQDPQAARTSRHIAAAMIGNIDHNVGRIIDDLRGRGLLDDTVIVFMSDNGVFFGEHGLVAKGPYTYQQQLRVPFVMRWSGLGKKGETITRATTTMDILPTLLDIAGIDWPATIDADSFAPLLTDGKAAYRAAIPFQYYGMSSQPNQNYLIRGVVTNRWKWTHFFPGTGEGKIFDRHQHELYDLSADPGEQRNLMVSAAGEWRSLATALNDPQIGPVLQGLRQDMARIMAQSDDPLRPRIFDIRYLRRGNKPDVFDLWVLWRTPLPTAAEARVRIAQCADCPWIPVASSEDGTIHRLRLKDLSRNQTYEVEVFAYDAEGSGDYARSVITP